MERREKKGKKSEKRKERKKERKERKRLKWKKDYSPKDSQKITWSDPSSNGPIMLLDILFPLESNRTTSFGATKIFFSIPLNTFVYILNIFVLGNIFEEEMRRK